MSETAKKPAIADVPKARIGSIRITDNDGIILKPGDVYELDFCRESVRFAERMQFDIDDSRFTQTYTGNLFYLAFRMHHRNVPRDKTDKLLEHWNGLTPKVLERLVSLYHQAELANTLQTEEEAEKNGAVTVEMED